MELERRISDTLWDLHDGRGNHRILLQVDAPAPYVQVSVKWRRRDYNPENTALLLIHRESETKIPNIHTLRVTREEGVIVFEAPYAGVYELYYLPHRQKSGNIWFPVIDYTKANMAPVDAAWEQNIPGRMPEATALYMESRTAFDSFYPMEVPATRAEADAIIAAAGDAPWIPFTEDRKYPVKMFNEIPYKWVEQGSRTCFHGQARPDEYYVFQVVLWTRRPVNHIRAGYRMGEGEVFSSDALTCFQTEGVDWTGKPFTKDLCLPENHVQTFWIGVDLAKDKTGTQKFQVVLTSDCGEQVFDVQIDVAGENLPKRGDGELWRMTRLRWLNSTIGLNYDTTDPFPAMELTRGNLIGCAGKQYALGENGLPAELDSFYDTTVKLCDTRTPILNRPMTFDLYAGGSKLEVNHKLTTRQLGTGSIAVDSVGTGSGLTVATRGTVEYDGYADLVITVTSEQDMELDDARLNFGMTPHCSAYMMGMGKEGGSAPESWDYSWAADRTNNFLWVGGVNGGMEIKLKHTQDVWELYTYQEIGLPDGWYNEGRGGCHVEKDEAGLRFTAFTGSRKLKQGQSVTYRVALLPTPFFELRSDEHWTDRYEHPGDRDIVLEETARDGATVVNLHHSRPHNRFINFPFLEDDALKAEIHRAHELGVKFKLYYTIRELTTHANEYWVLRSLGDEILMKGHSFRVAEHFKEEFFNQDTSNPSTGGPWVCEHLPEGYIPAWQTQFADGDYDCSVATVGLSRWHNYYLEGLRWLTGELDADGIYLDGVGYDRSIMKRVRKVMNDTKPGCLMDLHSGNNFHPQYGLCNVLGEYMELLPSVNSLWIGEAFDYETTEPDYWITEVAGIPLGLMSDLLHRGGNKWRGMVFGMTPRLNFPEGGDPKPVWKLWNEFGMTGCRVQGWWSDNCPVKLSDPKMKATAFVQEDRALIAIGSWDPEETRVSVEIDYTKLPFSGENAVLTVPEIEDFQHAQPCGSTPVLTVAPGQGKIILIHKN